MAIGHIVGLWLALAAVPAAAEAQTPAAVTEPIWAKPDTFWYRRSLPEGHVWLKVDAEHGVKEPLFDHQRLAIELTLRTGVEYTPTTLPFVDPATQFVVKYDGSNAYIQEGAMAVEFIHDGQYWRCDLQIKWDWNRIPPTDYECLARRAATDADQNNNKTRAAASATRVSPDGRWVAVVDNHNVAIRPASESTGRLTVLSSDGTAANAYQPGSLRWSADSKTLTAYRVSADVWTSESLNGNVKKSVTKGQWNAPVSGPPAGGR